MRGLEQWFREQTGESNSVKSFAFNGILCRCTGELDKSIVVWAVGIQTASRSYEIWLGVVLDDKPNLASTEDRSSKMQQRGDNCADYEIIPANDMAHR